MIPLFYPYIPKKKILKEISDTLDGRWLGQGPKVDLFEKKFGEKFGYKHSLFTNSGTAALELAYHLIGLKAGDEVIVPVLDCTAGQMGLKRLGVKIIFADIDTRTFNISYADLKSKITKRTKAVVAVALGGIEIDSWIYPMLQSKKIPLILDAAQDLQPQQLKADYVCYSFQAIKHITTCDGGMLVLKDKKTYDRAKKLRWFGIDRDLKKKKNYQAWANRQMTFDVDEAGFKFQPTDIDACFGLASLPDLDKVIEHRQMLCEEYVKGLAEVDVELVYGGSCWLFGLHTDRRDELAAYLTKNGIENNLIHLRNDIFKIFGGKRLNLPNMNYIESRYLYLPLNTKVTMKDVKYICKTIKQFYAK